MRKAVNIGAAMLALGLFAVTAAVGAEWQFEGGSVPIAYVDNEAAQLQFACRGGDLALGYWVRKPEAAVAGAAVMSLAITPDGSKDAAPGAESRFAQELPLIHSQGSSVIVRGPVARQWARIAQRAGTSIRIAYVRSAASGRLEVFDSNDFGAKGSSSAIEQVLDRCG